MIRSFERVNGTLATKYAGTLLTKQYGIPVNTLGIRDFPDCRTVVQTINYAVELIGGQMRTFVDGPGTAVERPAACCADELADELIQVPRDVIFPSPILPNR